jgi:hypothetical protein
MVGWTLESPVGNDGLSYSFPVRCMDPLAAAPPHTIVAKKFDADLGTLDFPGAPYLIKINFLDIKDFQFCNISISLQSFPMAETSYCYINAAKLGRNPIKMTLYNKLMNSSDPESPNQVIVVDWFSYFYGIRTIRYDFVSPKG